MSFKVVFILSLMQYFAFGELESHEPSNEKFLAGLEDQPILKLLQNILDIPLDNKESSKAKNTGSQRNKTESQSDRTGPWKNDIKPPNSNKTPAKKDTHAPKDSANPPKDNIKPPKEALKPPKEALRPPKEVLNPPNDNKKRPKGPPAEKPNSSKDSKTSPKAGPESLDKLESKSTDDECPGDKSLHSKSDLKYLIDFVYDQLSIDEKIRRNYQAKALQHRDNYLRRVKEYQNYLHDSPNHFKHIVASLSTIRKDIIEKKLRNAAQLLNQNWELLNTYKEKNKLFVRLTQKLSRYQSLCSFNCEEDNYYDEGHVVLRRSVPNVYYCSSLKDLYNKVKEKLSEFEVIFSQETVNRFSNEDKEFRNKMENLKQNFKQNGLQNVVGAMFDILMLQDEYHHLAESLNYSSIVARLNLIRNLTLQSDTEIFYLSHIIEEYGQHCRSCDHELFRRSTRQVVQMKNDKSYKKVLNNLISEKFNQTASLIQNDWDNIFKNVTEILDENKNANSITKEFGNLNKEVNEIIKRERQALKNLQSDVSLLKVKDWQNLVHKLGKLILRIRKTFEEVSDLLNH